jgi:hypothetical protein
MNEDPSKPPPVPGNKAAQKIMWVFVAFLPSLVGIILVSATNTQPGVLPFLVILDAVCSIAATTGLVQGIKGEGTKFLVAFLLVPSFFFINALIVVFIGCAIALHGI